MKPKYFLKKIKDVRFNDMIALAKYFLARAITPTVKDKIGNPWVVCETGMEARDNGYHFFKYMRENHPDEKCYYAIKAKSPDYKRVSEFGNVIEYGSLKHWLMYLCAEYNISSQKGGKPNAAVCAFLELMGWIDSRFVFLQHGVTINDVKWAHAETTQLEYFIASARPEAEFIREKFGFLPKQIQLTGFPRFDNLHNLETDNKFVLIMPTWRSRFTLNSQKDGGDSDFHLSRYKRCWEELLNSTELERLQRENGLKIMFFPHRNMQAFLNDFSFDRSRIQVGDWETHEIQEMMKRAAVMVTDYSSVFFDMVYMRKPVIFYQFDYDQFRAQDYPDGWFDYRSNQFGHWCETPEEVVKELNRVVKQNFQVSDAYLQEHARTFPLYDTKNSERIYDLLRSNPGEVA